MAPQNSLLTGPPTEYRSRRLQTDRSKHSSPCCKRTAGLVECARPSLSKCFLPRQEILVNGRCPAGGPYSLKFAKLSPGTGRWAWRSLRGLQTRGIKLKSLRHFVDHFEYREESLVYTKCHEPSPVVQSIDDYPEWHVIKAVLR